MALRGAGAALALAVVLALGVCAAQPAQAQTFTVLYNFGGTPDAGNPYAGLVRDEAGNLYGTTAFGGAFRGGGGAVFKVHGHNESVLYSFCFLSGCPDGSLPYSSLVRDAAGNLYGTTFRGGTGCSQDDCGTVFKVDSSGTETVLYSFTGGTTDGCNPWGGLVRDGAGNLYGTTSGCGASGWGTVFKVDTSDAETVLHNFSTSEGGIPEYTALLMDKGGNLYGFTGNGSGVLYKLSSSGTFTVLHTFGLRRRDGTSPYGTPAMDKDGNLYGTTRDGGSHTNGIVWKVSQKGKETVLHRFRDSDGVAPIGGVVLDGKGNLYGTTQWANGVFSGTVYKLNKKGVLTVLHFFNGTDGAVPYGNLILDKAGNLYGTASEGGSSGTGCGGVGCGTVWKVTP